MKKLFSIKDEGLFWVEVENKVYSVFDRKSNAHKFFDASGNIIPDYSRPKIETSDKQSETDWDYDEDDELIFNQYGIACGDTCLVDRDGNAIPDTSLNLEADCGEYDRYFTFGTTTAEQDESISRCGTTDDIVLDIYDTKTRKYVAKGIPECCLDVSFYDGEPEVILAAIELLLEYETVDIRKTGTILARKEGVITVFNYYEN
ncbi:MAG: hypothetical protein IKU84_03935 [Clostridia bacterium]|nr:hypothetical protein [Clostridia bacterium]